MLKRTEKRLTGDKGEAVARAWLKEQGYWVIPASLIESGGAPAMTRYIQDRDRAKQVTTKKIILPDVLTFQEQSPRWVEVKTKSRVTFNNIRRREEHGINERHWKAYNECVRETGIPGALAIVELSSWQLIIGNFEIIYEGSRHANDINTVRAYRCTMRFFDRRRFDWYPLDDLPMEPIESRRPQGPQHPWDNKQSLTHRQLPMI